MRIICSLSGKSHTIIILATIGFLKTWDDNRFSKMFTLFYPLPRFFSLLLISLFFMKKRKRIPPSKMLVCPFQHYYYQGSKIYFLYKTSRHWRNTIALDSMIFLTLSRFPRKSQATHGLRRWIDIKEFLLTALSCLVKFSFPLLRKTAASKVF